MKYRMQYIGGAQTVTDLTGKVSVQVEMREAFVRPEGQPGDKYVVVSELWQIDSPTKEQLQLLRDHHNTGAHLRPMISEFQGAFRIDNLTPRTKR